MMVLAVCTSRFTAKERDSETQLDFFQARYFTSAQGRFTSPDPGNAGADPFDPQSWNGYAYVKNNPLNAIDPDGLSDFSVTGYGVKDIDPWSPGGALFDLWYRTTFQSMQQIQQVAQQVAPAVQQAVDWWGQPRDMGCLAASTSRGAITGGAGGALAGLAGGPGAPVTVPTASAGGFLAGGLAGWAGGMVSCMSSSGGTGSSGQATGNDKSPKEWQITNPADKKVVGGRTYLKDAKTGTWWSKDTAGHGGSVWKVYKETSPGKLDWIADADAQGNFISGKWKSPVGTSITF